MVSVVLATASVIRVSLRVSRLTNELDELDWIAENTHSSMVYEVIEDCELWLDQSRVLLKGLEKALLVVLIGGSILLGVINNINTPQQVAGVFLMFVLLALTLHIPSAYAISEGYYPFMRPL